MIGSKRKKRPLPLLVVLLGLLLTLVTLFALGWRALLEAEELAHSTTQTLLRQCKSFDNIQSVNRVRNLFSINENLTSLNTTFNRDPTAVNDAFLEAYVDGMQLSGVAVLDDELELVASAYTRPYRKENWRDDFPPLLFEHLLERPSQVYAQRMRIDGQYYDICATARADAAGVIIAYYKQPMSMINDTEGDLRQLLENVRMDMNGEFIIEHEGRMISDGVLLSTPAAFLKQAEGELISDELRDISFDGGRFYGVRTVAGNYTVCVYFPFASVYRDAWIGSVFFLLLYTSFCLVGVAVRSRTARQRGYMLEESNRKLVESMSVLRSLETVYFTIVYVDLERDTYESIILASWIRQIIPESGVFTVSLDRLLEASVLRAHREMLRERMSFTYIRAHLKRRTDIPAPTSYYADYEVERGEGSLWCRMTVTAVDFDMQGEPLHALVLLQDINAEKSREVAYQAQIIKEADLAQAANRAKSAFLFNVSHDIRTPMNAILGYSNLAVEHLQEPERLDRYLHNIQISGERMLSLINEVLELARIENGKIAIQESAARVGDGIRSCLVIVAPAANEKHITISLEISAIKHQCLYIDHAHMARIVLNLLNNAIKFTNDGGHIDCFVNQLPAEQAGYCTTEVIIADNGIGISKEFLPHIFEMFERERNSTVSGVVGTGLGLGIAKRLAVLMNGTIDVQSEVGKGSTFTVRIPHRIASEADVDAVEIGYHLRKESVRGKRILIAEDGDMNAEILTEILLEEGVETERATDGAACLQMLTAAPRGYYNLILMDIQMPAVDGIEATRSIRESEDPRLKDIPIVAMTANAFPEDIERSLEAGMNAHLSKPIDIKELMLVLEKFLPAELTVTRKWKNSGGGV